MNYYVAMDTWNGFLWIIETLHESDEDVEYKQRVMDEPTLKHRLWFIDGPLTKDRAIMRQRELNVISTPTP